MKTPRKNNAFDISKSKSQVIDSLLDLILKEKGDSFFKAFYYYFLEFFNPAAVSESEEPTQQSERIFLYNFGITCSVAIKNLYEYYKYNDEYSLFKPTDACRKKLEKYTRDFSNYLNDDFRIILTQEVYSVSLGEREKQNVIDYSNIVEHSIYHYNKSNHTPLLPPLLTSSVQELLRNARVT